MYEQSLVKVVEPIKKTTITRMNRGKKWKYGYNKEHDIVVISKTGKIGEILEIQNLRIGLPLEPMQVHVHKPAKWQRLEYPKELSKLKNIFDWRSYPEENKEQWFEFIDEEFKRREEGFWFMNNKTKTYITGSHYMYLQWSKIDVGCFIYSGKLVKLIKGVTVCVTLKIVVVDFLLCLQQKQLI